jgi:AcrR family transcriptional regulator
MTTALSKGERTSNIIVEAAYSLFLEQGYHATSMRQIAQRAGVAVGGIYNHFSSKEQIFDQVLLEKHPYRQLLTILQATPGKAMDEFIHNAASTIVDELGRRPEFIKLVFIELSEFKGIHAPHLFQTIFPQFLPFVQRFGGSQSQLRDLPPQAILLSFIGIFISYYLTSYVIHSDGKSTFDHNELEHFLEIYLHGILKLE